MTEVSRLKLAGSAAIGAAVLIAVAVTMHPEGLKTPAWVAYLAATSFGLAGLSAWAGAYQRRSLAYGLVCWLLAAMFFIELWVAFGPGERLCLATIPGVAGFAAGSGCRAAFGLGALLVGAILVLAVRAWRNVRSGN